MVFGWFSRKKPDDDEKLISAARTVVAAYGNVLEMQRYDVCDSKELPYEKEVIEKALMIAIATEKDTGILGHLSGALVLLSQFQLLTPYLRAARTLEQSATDASPGAADDELKGIAISMAETGKLLMPLRAQISVEMAAYRKKFDELMEVKNG